MQWGHLNWRVGWSRKEWFSTRSAVCRMRKESGTTGVCQRARRSPVPIPAGETPSILKHRQCLTVALYHSRHVCSGIQSLRKNKTWMQKVEANRSAFSLPRFVNFLTGNFINPDPNSLHIHCPAPVSGQGDQVCC